MIHRCRKVGTRLGVQKAKNRIKKGLNKMRRCVVMSQSEQAEQMPIFVTPPQDESHPIIVLVVTGLATCNITFGSVFTFLM